MCCLLHVGVVGDDGEDERGQHFYAPGSLNGSTSFGQENAGDSSSSSSGGRERLQLHPTHAILRRGSQLLVMAHTQAQAQTVQVSTYRSGPR